MLCNVCKRVLSEAESEDRPIDANRHHHPDEQSFELANTEHCFICQYLWEAAQGEAVRDVFPTTKELAASGPEFQQSVARYGWEDPKSAQLYTGSHQLNFWTLNKSSKSVVLVRFILLSNEEYDKGKSGFRGTYSGPQKLVSWLTASDTANPNESLQQTIANSENEGRGISAQTWTTIQTWIRGCNAVDHPKCYQSGPSDNKSPTRLLNITNLDNIYLELTDQSPIKYATLSHCWGTTRLLTMTKSNMKDLMIKIEEKSLPKTFRDAITIARKLNVSYLWIDSLCICQDDPEDWKVESQRMADVYNGSYCNVAATKAHNSSVGCLSQSDRYFAGPCTFTSATGKEYFVLPKLFWQREMSTQPLLTRGWVVQERILAPRTLHFSRHQVFWECSHVVACEAYPERLPLNLLDYRDATLLWKTENHKGEDEAGLSWRSIVEAYSKCLLTYEKDKMPAIEGVARFCGRDKKRGRYIAGLWEESLLTDLLWAMGDGVKPTGTPPAQHRAPSWSWASLDGSIRFFHLEVIFVSSVPGSAKILSTVKPVELPDSMESSLYSKQWYLRLEGPIVIVLLRWRMNGMKKEYDMGFPNMVYPVGQAPSCNAYFDEGSKYYTNLVFVPLKYASRQRSVQFNSLNGLLLRPTGKVKGQYQRVGVMIMERVADPLESGSWSTKFIYSNFHKTLYESVRSEHNLKFGMDLNYYTITIV